MRGAVACALFIAAPLACGRAEVYSVRPDTVSCGEMERCDGVCVDITSDPQHCGTCSVECESDQTCVMGECKRNPCGPGLVDCNGLCADLLSDVENCGACDAPCDSDQLCVDGKCEIDCLDLENCGGDCIDTSADDLHCGFCFNSCDDNEMCVASECACVEPGTCNLCGVLDLPSSIPQSVLGQLSGENQSDPSCGFTGNSEEIYRFIAPSDATYLLDVASGFLDVLYVIDPTTCDELACAFDITSPKEVMQLPLTAGQEVLIAVDGNAFHNFNLSIDQL